PHTQPLVRTSLKNMKKMRVLVVDDEENSRDILHQYILSWGMRNGRARNADEALEILRSCADSDPYALALIDLFMTGTNGMQLGKIIREDDRLKSMKLILVTAYDNPGAGEDAIKAGFDGYLTKPVKQSQLLDCITTVVSETDSKFVSRSSATRTVSTRALDLSQPSTKRTESILIVEDHAINQEVAQLLLRDLGFEAHIASNGRHALEMIQKRSYNLIFMDCQMPELDGFGATSAIRKNETRTGKHIPIVAMTAHAMEGSREQCLSAGMDDYISKPIDPDLLQEIVEKWLPSQAVAEGSGDSASNGDAAEAKIEEKKHSEPIDLATLTKRYGEKNIDKLLNAFLRDAPGNIAKLNEHQAGQSMPGVLSVAHGLKGISGTVFANEIRQTCIDIEKAGREKDWDTTGKLIARLDQELQSLTDHLQTARPK
ncbi:MAG: response regulator, partial [Terriglobales bacterium]